jgi:hypothetical protein
MVLNATFNNISVISWQSVLLMEEIRVPGENHRPVASHCQTLSHNIVSSTPRQSTTKLMYAILPFKMGYLSLNHNSIINVVSTSFLIKSEGFESKPLAKEISILKNRQS